MSDLVRSTETHHRLDGHPDERLHQRDPALGFRLRNPVEGEVIDISAGGLGIVCPRPLNLRTQYPFTLAIGPSRARVRGEVRWCRLVGTGLPDGSEPAPIYRLGVAFVDP